MRILQTFLFLAAATSAAQAQSLLGDSGASPNDPPPRPAFKKRDHLLIAFPEKEGTRVDAPRGHAGPPLRTVAAEVVDIRPNGVLVVQAIQRRVLNGVEERLRLTGEVAPDALRGNTVIADKVANLCVAVEGAAASPGLGGILGRLWPF